MISARCFLVCVLFCAMWVVGCNGGEQAVDTQPPNLIFLLTDDQRWDALGYAGNSIIQTPNMDALAAGGLYFPNAYVTTAICSVSRASIFSGQYARRHGIHGFATSFSDSAFAQTYPMLLKEAGYRVGFIGKYGVGREAPEAAFDDWYGFNGQGYYEGEDENGDPQHLTARMGAQAKTFLAAQAKDQPFSLSISFKAPHVQDQDPRQFVYDPAYADLYQTDTIPLPETAADRYFEAFPEFFTANNEGRHRWEKRFATPEAYQTSVKGYYRLVTGIDRVLGDLREELDKQGFSDNTVIILMGDNGFFLGEHGLAGKWYGYEESIRVPFFVYDPRLLAPARGQTFEEMVLNIDVAPTLLDLAGIPIPEGMQGRSVFELVRGTATDWRTAFFYEHLFDYEPIPKSEGVVSLTEKYLRYVEQDPVYEELFDLVQDPHETSNLATDPDHQVRLDQMRHRLDVLREAAQ